MANREWLKNYLGAVLELDSPILEAINENALKPVLLGGLDLYNYVLLLALNRDWVIYLSSWHGDPFIHFKKNGIFSISFAFYAGNKFNSNFNSPTLRKNWSSIGTEQYEVDGEEVSYVIWIKSLEAAILQ